MADVILPNNWRPRPYQYGLWKYLEDGGKRAYQVAHRRWGKDDVCLHWTATAAFERVGSYWHMLPEAAQARKAIWKAVNPHTGKRRIDEAFPPAIRKSTNDNEMFIEFVNGSTWQVLGSDNYDSHVGSAPAGIVFSEWALADPAAWAYMQPILEENGGWALFITTPRGRNHGATFFDMARKAPEWWAEKQTVNDTNVFREEQLENILRELIAQYGIAEGKSKFEQEYFCSFDAALPGAYFGTEMNKAESDGRITVVPYKAGYPVYPSFDFGRGQSNATSIVFWQVVGYAPRVIDYEEGNTGRLDDYAKTLKAKPYVYGKLLMPHDAEPERLNTGLSYADQFRGYGFDVHVMPRTPNKNTDINIARQVIDETAFDEENCSRLIDCLRSYHREWDEKNKTFLQSPKHDWASHGADGFMQGARAFREGLMEPDTFGDDGDDYYGDFTASESRNSLSGY